MSEEIKFFIPKDEIIPTQLRLKIGDIYIIYKPVIDELGHGYNFSFYRCSLEEAMRLTKEIADKMVWQSEDHGSRWDIKYIKPVDPNTIRVVFRLRDSY